MNSENKLFWKMIAIVWAVRLGLIGYQIYKFNKMRKPNKCNWKDAAKVFGVKASKLKKMSKEEIKNLYRKLAKKYHPDHGGDPDKFRDLHTAYEFVYAA